MTSPKNDEPEPEFEVGEGAFVPRIRCWVTVLDRRISPGKGAWPGGWEYHIQRIDDPRRIGLLWMPGTELLHTPAPPNDLSEGDTLLVTWGTEKYSPKAYMSFDVGPLYAKTKVRAGETADEAHARVWRWLEERAREQFNSQLNRFRINLQEL